jgi:predicted Zn finger-like uncharacterized protein
MSMHTRCTHCEAVFRVTLLQLQSSSGRVRCGVCQQVFDAFVHLRAADPPPAEPVTPPEPLPEIDLPDEPPAPGDVGTAPEVVPPDEALLAPPPPAGPVDEEAPDHRQAELPDSAGIPGSPAQNDGRAPDEFFVEEIIESAASDAMAFTTAPDATPGAADGWPPADDEEDATLHPLRQALAEERDSESGGLAPALAIPQPQVRRRRWPLVAGVSAAVVLLAGQTIHQFRTPIATALPALRPALESACAMAGCTVPLPGLPDRLVIETSDLRALDPTRPNRVVLATTIRNAAPMAQAYPMLELTLTDARDKLTARKVFHPHEYLDAPPAKAAGLGADAEFSVRMQLDIGDIEASGYRIYLFHR